jgi:aminoglycoside phosphotransferase
VTAVAAYLDAHREELDLEGLGIPPAPGCVVLTPRFPRSRCVITLVFGERGRWPVLVAKTPRLPNDAGRLAHEAAMLEAAGRATAQGAATAPVLLAFDGSSRWPLLLETALPGRPVSPAAVRRDPSGTVGRVADALGTLAEATARMAPPGWYGALIEQPLTALAAARTAANTDLVETTLAVLEPLRGARLPLVLEHGDVSHPNLLLLPDGRVGLLDWERARDGGLPVGDLLCFLSHAARAQCQERDEVFWGARRWATDHLVEYADRIGVRRDQLPLLMLAASALTAAREGAGGAVAQWQWMLRHQAGHAGRGRHPRRAARPAA